jgi:flagellar hook-length control protein FliK
MPVQVTSAQPLAKAFQTGSFDKEKALQFEPGKLNFEGDIVGGSSLEGSKSTRQTVNAVMSTVATRAELPVNVARQIAEVAARGPGQSVEVALHPAELGRVRMTLSAADTGMVISIQTERIETLDLMRRNIEALETAFVDLGYSDISFSFGTGEQGSPDRDPAETFHGQAGPLMIDDIEGQSLPSNSAGMVGRVQGLDVRV